MHKEILTKEQIELLPLLKGFSKNFGLVGGTAIALHLGHRRSVDFDLFSLQNFNNISIKKNITARFEIENIFVNKMGEYTISIQGVKVTFFHYPFPVEFSSKLNHSIGLPDLITLAAMKAYALGMRAKWKDYVDLYFIIKDCYKIDEIIQKAKEIFAKDFNEKIFRTQLAYFNDIDYSEKVIFLKGFEAGDPVIKNRLREWSLA